MTPREFWLAHDGFKRKNATKGNTKKGMTRTDLEALKEQVRAKGHTV